MERSTGKLHKGQASFVLSESILPFGRAELLFQDAIMAWKNIFSLSKQTERIEFLLSFKIVRKGVIHTGV